MDAELGADVDAPMDAAMDTAIAADASRDSAPDGVATDGGVDDGFANAPQCTPQNPNMFKSYVARPPWKVAGVDYCVGYPSATTLKDPATINHGGETIAGFSMTMSPGGLARVDTTSNVVIDGYDFTLNGGHDLIFVGSSNGTIKNSKFGSRIIQFDANSPGGTVEYSTFVQIAAGSNTDAITMSGGGDNVLRYCSFSLMNQHVLELNTSSAGTTSLDYRFNYIENSGTTTGAHVNYTQLQGTNFGPITVDFNTGYQTPQNAGGEAWQCTAGGTFLAAVSYSHNTTVGLSVGGMKSLSYVFHVGTKMPSAPPQVHDNYIDATGAYGPFYPGTNAVLSNNIDMTTGAMLP